MPYQTARGTMDINDEATRDNINVLLNSATSLSFPNPYVALEKVKKVLANWHIFLPRTVYMQNDHGVDVWPIEQFGGKAGMTDDGQYKVADADPYYVFFEYALNDAGTFTVYCEVVSEDELEDLQDAVNSDEETLDEETLNELSMDTMKSYAQKAGKQAGKDAIHALLGDKDAKKRLKKRMRGAKLLAKKDLGEASGAKLGKYVTDSGEWIKDRNKKNKETHERMKAAFSKKFGSSTGLGGPIDSKLYRRERNRKLALKKLAGEGGVKVSAKLKENWKNPNSFFAPKATRDKMKEPRPWLKSKKWLSKNNPGLLKKLQDKKEKLDP
jgi:hypothetical protein